MSYSALSNAYVRGNWKMIMTGIEEAIHDSINPVRQKDGFLDLVASRNLYHKVVGKAELLRNLDESCHHNYSKLVNSKESDEYKELEKLKDDVMSEFEKLDKFIAVLEGTIDEAYRISKLINK